MSSSRSIGFPSFDDFFAEVHGASIAEIDSADAERVAPFPWQSALALHVAEHGDWPDQVAVPTGLGKTTCIDIAVWDLARQLHEQARNGRPRTAALRIIHVIDRQTVINQTGSHLAVLRDALNTPARTDSAVGRVQDALAQAFPPGPDGQVMTFETFHAEAADGNQWLRGHRPAVVSTTPHQFVSRLLFRGFGVSPGMSPVHAGLAGLDRLVLFDEPHLSVPAIQTIRAQQALAQSTPLGGVPAGRLVLLGASQPPLLQRDKEPKPAVHTTTPADEQHPVAGPRLAARRDLVLHPAKDTDADVRRALVRAARACTAERVIVFANTVAMAQDVQADLEKAEPGSTLLVTARFRPHDRKAIDTKLSAWETTTRPPRFIVATQTLEAGMDLSAGEIVTEACPWPALQQRVGRLNRRGEHDQATVHVITGIRKGTEAVYDGDAVTATLDLLSDVTDLSIATQQHLDTAKAWGLLPQAPTLHAGLLSTLVHTRPRPVTDIDVTPFIVGRLDKPRTADVTVLWRTHTDAESLATCGPVTGESLEVPVSAARALYRAAHHNMFQPSEFGDAALADDDTERTRFQRDDVLRPPLIRNADTWQQAGSPWRQVDGPWQITPGSTVVFPTTYGGYTPDRGWEPASRALVTDLSALALDQGGRFQLSRLSMPSITAAFPRTDTGLLAEALDELLTALDEDPLAEPLASGIEEHLGDIVRQAKRPVAGHGAATTTRATGVSFVSLTDGGVVLAADQTGQSKRRRTRPISLEAHSRDVADRAAQSARRLGLTGHLAAAVEHAGYWHDSGKSWGPFQEALHATAGEKVDGTVLAKSGLDDLPPGARNLASRRADVPPWWRHEARSARDAIAAGANDLVVHLVSTHHGWSRPLMPPSCGTGGVNENHVDAAADRFDRLNTEFGPWGLAFLESVVRLADHAASSSPNLKAPPPTTALPRQGTCQPPPGTVSELALTGLPFDSPLAWWAAFGTLVAASTLDARAKIFYRRQQGQLIPVLHSTVSLPEVAAELARTPQVVAEARNHLPGLLAKNQKVALREAEHVLASLDMALPAHRIIAGITSDIVATDGSVRLRTPFEPANANGLKSALEAMRKHTGDQAVQALHALLTNPADTSQYIEGNIHGMAENQANRSMLDGLGDARRTTVRAIALIPVVHGLQAITNNGHDALTFDNGQMRLPVPAEPVSAQHLLALMRTVPKISDRPWGTAGVAELVTFERRKISQYFSVYALSDRTTYPPTGANHA